MKKRGSFGPFDKLPDLPDSPWSPDGSRFAFIASSWTAPAGSDLYVDGVLQTQGASLSDLVWASDSVHLAYQRGEGKAVYSKVFFTGNEYPGAVFAGKLVMVENGKLSFK